MDEPRNHPGDGAPMACTVYQSKLYSLALLCFVLAFAAACTWFFPHFRPGTRGHMHPAPTFPPYSFMPVVFALFISAALAAVIHSLVTRKLMVSVDELGIHYPRGMIPLIDWADVIAVDRAPKVQRIGGETQHYLRDAWRPLRVTVRNPDKYSFRVQKWARTNLTSLVPDADRTVVHIEFMGMTPGSDVVEACIQRYLARVNRQR